MIQESIYPQFMEKVLARIATIRQGDPFDTETAIGAQASKQQYDKILSYIDIAKTRAEKSWWAANPPSVATKCKTVSTCSRR